ncbi:secretory pathway Sec39 [Macroventuria anomochaeta]|uniref:Secretory pathway Sec39 n=1 Tax=Macroventuria anomochaeta TaxID=301207 RepID=A0ACB6S294_9PLEO|nr:secretory pathway Sec39 [Macroventuria anomochaeta]KAF2628158.1 secretory pathway Sec39 [Macroventuria anomochaeta]
MSVLQRLQKLSELQCLLLAVQYATESNIDSLRALTALRESELPFGLVLNVLLTFLPEGAEPTAYVEYLNELATGPRHPGDDPAAHLAIAAVEALSKSQAKKRRREIELLPLVHPQYAAELELDPFSHFLIHRAHRIDSQTGLLDLVPQLIVPFLHHSEYLRTWFISTALPLLRLSYEYYPQGTASSLDEFASLRGKRALDFNLSNLRAARKAGADTQNAARDLRGIVSPWICGASDRKRRKISSENRRASMAEMQTQESNDWDCLFRWLLHTSKEDLPLVAAAISEWDGPEDMDLGGFEEGRDYVDEDTQRRLETKYAQTALSCLYLVDASDVGALQTAHALLTRICDLLHYDPPPDLNIGVESLPSYDLKIPILQDATSSLIQEERLLASDNDITKPEQGAFRIIELVLFSACVLSSLQHPVSPRTVANLSLRDDYAEQSALLQKVLHALSGGPKKDSGQWRTIRSKLLWLWNWGTDAHDNDRHGQGILGMLEKTTIETEILKSLIEGSHFPLAAQIYVNPAFGEHPLLQSEVEKVVLSAALHHYDNASNGNRNRGGMKRCAEIVAAFAPHFSKSSRFQQTQALLSATHAMSFYSLILQHGVPFQPVSIRVSSDPLSLIQKLLLQNLGSYTKLDDMISIGQNLVVSMPSTIMDDAKDAGPFDATTVEKKKAAAERRVIGMAIDAALEEGDFETAYSYVVNRLTPTATPSPAVSTSSQRFSFDSDTSAKQADDAEDVAWRAALRAGRYKPSLSSSGTWSHATSARPDLRHLEQRMELLSQALLLAPPAHLEEVLNVWQQCEAEMTELLAQETEAEERFNDAADRKLPGAFDMGTIPTVQPRREVGRGAVEESPMGLFDVARGAAAAFSKSAFPLRSNTQTSPRPESRDAKRVSMDLSDSDSMHGHEERVRRRDMLANTASGALQSGLGWVLGAKPVNDQGR